MYSINCIGHIEDPGGVWYTQIDENVHGASALLVIQFPGVSIQHRAFRDLYRNFKGTRSRVMAEYRQGDPPIRVGFGNEGAHGSRGAL